MKQVTYTILVLILFATNLHAQKTAPLNDVLKEVTEVLKEVETNSGIPKPKKVSVSFQTEASTETGGGVKILIFKFGRKWSKAESSEVTYDFEMNPSEKMVVTDLKEALSKAIKEAIQNVTKVDVNGLKVSTFAVKVGFTIEKSTDIEGEYEILPVTPSLNRSWKRKAIHDIEISFE